uniref:Uncharacterized protein n=1 Tax=Glossina pallidipes TaxID=7398 RepID=A0A1B0ADT3_GLOPL
MLCIANVVRVAAIDGVVGIINECRLQKRLLMKQEQGALPTISYKHSQASIKLPALSERNITAATTTTTTITTTISTIREVFVNKTRHKFLLQPADRTTLHNK